MIHLSSAAVAEILRLKAKRNNSQLFLRLNIESVGCLGQSYAMAFADTVHPDEQIFNNQEIQIVVSAEHLPYLNELVVDYSEDLMGGGFRFHNPNALQSCSCGNSFSVESIS